MAGEDYTSPITGLTYKVPMYEEPADAPVAFKDFADSITVGGPATREDAVLQALAGDQGLTWQEGMALSVVDAVPDDSVGQIGDVVFVTGPGDGGSSLVGGGKVLQVVRATDTSRRTSNSTNWVDVNGMSVTITPTKSDSHIMLFFSHRLAATGGSLNVAYVRITDSSGTPITGAEDVLWGQNDTTTGRFHSTMVAYDSPLSTNPVTYKLQNKTSAGSEVQMYNEQSTALMIAMEVSA